jgi:hypothetical protein
MVVDYTVARGNFTVTKPRAWFVRQLANVGLGRNLDIASDGKRFLVVMPAESSEPRETQSHVTLLTNFFDEVRRRVAAQAR